MIVRAQELSILTILLEYGKFIYFSKLKKESLRINQSIYKVLDIKPSHIIIKVILNYFQYFIFNSYKQTSLIKFYSIKALVRFLMVILHIIYTKLSQFIIVLHPSNKLKALKTVFYSLG